MRMKSNFSLLIKMRFLMFYNERLKTTKKKTATFSIALLLIAAVGFFSELFNKRVISGIFEESPELVEFLIPAIFSIFLSIVFIIQITESLKSLLPNFYKTADFQYLISMPIKMKDIMSLKFISHIFKTNKFFFFVFMTFIIALGKSVDFQWYLYLALIIAYVIVAISPTIIGIIIGMILLRFMKIKTYNKVMGTVSFSTTILFWYLFFSAKDLMEKISLFIVKIFENDIFVILFPPFSISNFLTNLYLNNFVESFKYLLFAVVVTILITLFGYFVVSKTYYKGWLNISSDYAEKKKKDVKKPLKKDFSQKSLIGTILKYEVARGFKNKEMIWPFLTCIIFQYSVIATFSFTKLLENSLLLQIAIIILVSDFFVNACAEILFLPAEAVTDKKLIKNRYIFYKFFPIDSKTIYFTNFLRNFIIAFFLAIPGSILFGIFNSLGIINTLLIILYQIGLLIASISINNALNNVYISKYILKKDFLGNLLYYLMLILLYFFTVGLIALYAFDFQFYHNTIFEPFLSFVLSNKYFVITTSVITMILSVVLSKKVGEKAWVNTEF